MYSRDLYLRLSGYRLLSRISVGKELTVGKLHYIYRSSFTVRYSTTLPLYVMLRDLIEGQLIWW